jgi:hypothetical protein
VRALRVAGLLLSLSSSTVPKSLLFRVVILLSEELPGLFTVERPTVPLSEAPRLNGEDTLEVLLSGEERFTAFGVRSRRNGRRCGEVGSETSRFLWGLVLVDPGFWESSMRRFAGVAGGVVDRSSMSEFELVECECGAEREFDAEWDRPLELMLEWWWSSLSKTSRSRPSRGGSVILACRIEFVAAAAAAAEALDARPSEMVRDAGDIIPPGDRPFPSVLKRSSLSRIYIGVHLFEFIGARGLVALTGNP